MGAERNGSRRSPGVDGGEPLRVSGIAAITAALFVAIGPVVYRPEFTASVWVFETAAIILLFSGIHILREPADLTEPIHWMNGLMVLMFIVHPYLTITTGIIFLPYHGKFNTAPHYALSCAIAFAGTASLNFFYALVVKRHQPGAAGATPRRSSRSAPIGSMDLDTLMRSLRALTGIGIGAAALAAVQGGSITSAFAKSEGLTSAYLYMAPLVLAPASCLWYAVGYWTNNPPYRHIGASIAGAIGVITILVGQRTGLITTAGPFLVTVVCFNRTKVPRIIAASLLLVGMFAFSLLRDINSTSASVTGNGAVVADFAHSPDQFLLQSLNGSDTEMVDAMAVETMTVPGSIPFSPGQELFAVTGAAVPRAIWASKPRTMDQRLNAALLGTKINEASIAYSFFGEGWYAGGFLGVILFGGVTGALFAKLRNIYRRSDRSILPTCLYALTTPLSVTHLRGSMAYTLAYCLFYIGPVLLLMYRSRTIDEVAPMAEAGGFTEGVR